ncbi:MAG: hypothetical protein AAF808_06800 [Cyanobacteria bacterium P01_D01_bin.2]
MLLLKTSFFEVTGVIAIVLLCVGAVAALVYLVRYAIRMSQEMATVQGEARRNEVRALVYSQTIEAEREAARANGRLEGLMLHLDKFSEYATAQAQAEQARHDLQRMRGELRIMQGQRDDLSAKYGNAMTRLNQAHALINDRRLDGVKKGSESYPEGVQKGPKLVHNAAEKLPGRGQTVSGQLPDLKLVPNRSYYLSWTDDGLELELYHHAKPDPLARVRRGDLQRGAYNPLTEGIGVIYCANCQTLKVSDRRAEHGRYCSKACSRQHKALQAAGIAV